MYGEVYPFPEFTSVFCTAEPFMQIGRCTTMVILSKYRIFSTNNKTYIIASERHLCPTCQGHLRPRDIKPRKVIDIDGKTYTYHLRRSICCNCGASHRELPDFIVPHKHYTKRAIEMALNDPNSTCSAETSTINRWIKERTEQKDGRMTQTKHKPNPG